MSGPSSQQLQLQDEQMQFYQQGMQESQTAFSEQQDLLKQMEAIYNPILAKGPNTNAFAGSEQTALDAEVAQDTSGNYQRAARAVGENIAAEGGGDNPLPSGSGEQLKEEVALSSAQQQSAEENQILRAGYAEGEHQFENAGQALSVASGQLNPVAFESAATSSGSAAEQTAHQINEEKNSWMAPVFGAIGSLGSSLLKGGIPGMGGGGGGGGYSSGGGYGEGGSPGGYEGTGVGGYEHPG
jgi:hypothetical protein